MAKNIPRRGFLESLCRGAAKVAGTVVGAGLVGALEGCAPKYTFDNPYVVPPKRPFIETRGKLEVIQEGRNPYLRPERVKRGDRAEYMAFRDELLEVGKENRGLIERIAELAPNTREDTFEDRKGRGIRFGIYKNEGSILYAKMWIFEEGKQWLKIDDGASEFVGFELPEELKKIKNANLGLLWNYPGLGDYSGLWDYSGFLTKEDIMHPQIKDGLYGGYDTGEGRLYDECKEFFPENKSLRELRTIVSTHIDKLDEEGKRTKCVYMTGVIELNRHYGKILRDVLENLPRN